MAKKTPPFHEYPKWTEAKFWAFIRSSLRRAWNKWPPKYNVLNDARRIVEGKRHKYEYQCASCGEWFKGKEVQVDHRIDAGSLKDYNDLPGFVERLFVGEDKLDVLCSPCHAEKTNITRKEKQDAHSGNDPNSE